MNRQFIRFGVLGIFVVLCTMYAQEPLSDNLDGILPAGETEEIEAIEVSELPDQAEESVLEEDAQEDEAGAQETTKETSEEVITEDAGALEVGEEASVEEEPAQEVDVVDEIEVPEEEQVSAAKELAEKRKREDSDAIIRDTAKVKVASREQESISPADLTFDIEKKRKETVNIVHRAMRELKSQPLDIACNRFSHTKKFIFGDLYIFLFDMNGTCLAHGDDAHLLWQNLYNLTDWVGTPFIKHIIKKAKSGGGWVTYGWHNATKLAYVQLVEKDGVAYAIGSGYYPHSKEEAVVNIVKGGVSMLKRIKKEKDPIDWAFSRMSYPSGQFVAGNLYLYALDFRGTIMAQGERPGLIGSNSWNYKDANGVYVNREIVKKLKMTTEGVWVEYISKRAKKKAYAEKVKGSDGKEYFIACGYYPEADRAQTIELVRKGYQFMKMHGKSGAVDAFSHRRSDEFRYGDLALMVYDLKGHIIADGSNADNVGRNMYDAQDEDGFMYIQNIIARATKEGSWTNAKIKGAFQSTYTQRIDLGIAEYVIACSYYPVSKPETMMLLVQSGASYLKANPREKAFAEFVKRDGRFQRGDLKLVVVDAMGLCYAYVDDMDLIWRNIFKAKDDDGRLFIKLFINEAKQGPSVVNIKLNGDQKTNFVTSLEKEGKTYVVSSGYYQ